LNELFIQISPMVAASEFAAKFGPEVAQLVFFDVLLTVNRAAIIL
jgi:hypothetical protein